MGVRANACVGAEESTELFNKSISSDYGDPSRV